MTCSPKADATVIVVTYNRPDHLRECLRHLARLTIAPVETIVVDASRGEASYHVVREAAGEVRYIHNPFGAGSTATSRALGVAEASGKVVAFVDDDAYVAADWLVQLLNSYRSLEIGGVGGRALNGQPGEESEGIGSIGRLLPDGTLTAFFAADPGHAVDVDHLLGANMSWRRSVLHEIGGIRDLYPGTCLREETDIALRVSKAGYRIVYNPAAVVRHVAGPYAKGKRFDLRYTYFAQRNHLVLLGNTSGPRSPQFYRYLGVAGRMAARQLAASARAATSIRSRGTYGTFRGTAGGLARAAAIAMGVVAGLGANLRNLIAD